MRLPVERRRAAPLRGAGFLDPRRLLPPVARRLVVAQELDEHDATGAVTRTLSPPRKRGPITTGHCAQPGWGTSFVEYLISVAMGPGSRGACHRAALRADPLAWPERQNYTGGLTALSSRPSARSRRKM